MRTPAAGDRPARALAACVAVAAVIALAYIVAYAPTGDPDVWWHLRAGELASRHVALGRDPFSYSVAGAPWRYRDALADTLLYRGFAALSFRWFFVLKVVAAVVEVLALAIFARSLDATTLIAGAGLLLASVPLVERPNLFTVACFPLFLALVERAREDRRWLAPALLLAWLWMALHRGGVLAIALLAALAACSLVTRRRRDALAFAAAALVASGLALCTPFGAELLRGSLGVAGSAALRGGISEWRRLPPRALIATFPLAFLLAAGALGLGAWKLRARTPDGCDAWHLLVVAGFAGLTLDSVRWVPYLAAASVLILARAAAADLARIPARPLPVLAFSLALAWLAHERRAPFALGEDRTRLPVAACGFLDRAQLSGSVANAFDEGGYLIWREWPRVRVLVDGRNETVYPPAFLARAVAAEHDPAAFDAMRARDGASLVVADNVPSRMSHAFLAEHAGWSMVFWSDAATVYARDDAHPELASLRYRLLDPRSLDGSVARVFARHDPALVVTLAAELGRALAADPDAIRPLVALAVFHQLSGDREARDAVLQRLERIAPDHPAVRELSRRLGR